MFNGFIITWILVNKALIIVKAGRYWSAFIYVQIYLFTADRINMVAMMEKEPIHSATPKETWSQATAKKAADNGSTQASKLASDARINFKLSIKQKKASNVPKITTNTTAKKELR